MSGTNEHIIRKHYLTNWLNILTIKTVTHTGQSCVTFTNSCSCVACLPPEYATRILTRDFLSCSLALRPQASPRGALLPTSGDKYIVPSSIISAWIQNKYKMFCVSVMEVTFEDSEDFWRLWLWRQQRKPYFYSAKCRQ